MTKLSYYIAGMGIVFTIGFYANQQYSNPAAKPAKVYDGKVVAVGSLASMPFVRAEPISDPEALPPPPHLRIQSADLGESGQPSPEEIAMQDVAHADMITSMRANHFPEDQITRLENEYAAKKLIDAQPQQYDQTPIAERSTAELAAELEQSMRQSGEPEEQIKEMVQRMYLQADEIEATQANAQLTHPDASLAPSLPPHPHLRTHFNMD